MSRPKTRRQDLLYLLAVVACAAAFVVEVVSLAVPPRDAASLSPLSPTAGEARDVDMDALLERIRQGHLSDHEALFQRPAEGPSDR